MEMFKPVLKTYVQYQDARADMDLMVRAQVYPGLKVRWPDKKWLKYKNRLAEVKDVFWEYEQWRKDPAKRLRVMVTVRTYRIDGQEHKYGDFIDDNDSTHRVYSDINFFEKAE